MEFPQNLFDEWNYEKNGRSLDFCKKSPHKIAWWICPKGHDYQRAIQARRYNLGCTVCEPDVKYNLKTVFPDIAKSLDPTKNDGLNIEELKPWSHTKVWWICKEKKHSYLTSPNSRVRGHGCPYCCNQKVCEDNNLAVVRPDLIPLWHPTKNDGLTPYDVLPNRAKAVWWMCEKKHSWKATMNNILKGQRCPYCSGRYATKENCLLAKRPDLAKEWHPTLNGELTPADVTPKSGKVVYWLCDFGHEWKQLVITRFKGKGCKHCRAGRPPNFFG